MRTKQEREEGLKRTVINGCKKIEDTTAGEAGHIFVKLCRVFEDDDGCTELVFSVPIRLVKEHTGLDSLDKITYWLENEYTSDDSQAILENAIIEDLIFNAKIN